MIRLILNFSAMDDKSLFTEYFVLRLLINSVSMILLVRIIYYYVYKKKGLWMGLFNSLQFSSMNSMAYADINEADSAMASTIASTMQQMSMSFGLACGSLVTAFYLADLPQNNAAAVTGALHHAFLTLAVLTLVSSVSFWARCRSTLCSW